MKRIAVLVCMGVWLLTACQAGPGATEISAQKPTATAPPEARSVRVMTHDSFDISEEIIESFEAEHGATVEILQAGDAGVALNQAILSVDNPLADVLFGVDNTLLSRALEAGIFVAYDSPLLSAVPDQLVLDGEHRALPVDYGDVCINYDKAWFSEAGLVPPGSLEDLVKAEYRGLTVVQNASTSSPGLAFMLSTIGHFGESGDYTWLDYWADLRNSDVMVVEGWEDAYWGQFTYGSGGEGERPLVVSYASSPPVEVHFAEEPFEEAPTGVVVGDGSCFRQIEFAGILKGARNRELAEAWIDYMLGISFQEDIPLNMFMFPANEEASLPQVFADFAVIPQRPAGVAFTAIEDNREVWIQAWTEVALN